LELETTASKKPKELLANFKKINPKEHESLTPYHYFLLPRRMNGYALAKKQRSIFAPVHCIEDTDRRTQWVSMWSI
jgi:hypothetical protein